jgi:hypothetical protein
MVCRTVEDTAEMHISRLKKAPSGVLPVMRHPAEEAVSA